MLCPSCFAEIPDFSIHCSECGARVDAAQSSAQNAGAQPQGAPVWSPPPYGTVPAPYSMSGTSDVLGVTDSITRPFKDPQGFRKMLIIAAWGMIPIAGSIIILGYLIDYAKRILKRENLWELPQVDDGIGFLGKGVMYFLASMVYTVVLMGVTGVSFVPFIGSIVALGPQIEKSSEPDFAIVMAILSAIAIPLMVFFLLMTVFLIFAPLIPLFYAKNDQFGDCFKIGDMFKLIFADLGTYIIIHLCIFCAGMLGTFITMPISLLPIIGTLLMVYVGPLLMVIYGSISISAFGEFYFKHRDRM